MLDWPQLVWQLWNRSSCSALPAKSTHRQGGRGQFNLALSKLNSCHSIVWIAYCLIASMLIVMSTSAPTAGLPPRMPHSVRSICVVASQPESCAPFMPGPKPKRSTLSITSLVVSSIVRWPVTLKLSSLSVFAQWVDLKVMSGCFSAAK